MIPAFPSAPKKRLETLPWWPGPQDAVRLAVAAAKELPPFALSVRFPDSSEMAIGYELRKQYGVPAEVYERADPPLLYIVVLDHLAGVGKDKGGLTLRKAANDAEKALKALERYIGREPVAVMASGINAKHSGRRYWWSGV